MQHHPDKKFATDIINFIDYGVPIYYNGPGLPNVYKNWNSCIKLSAEVTKNIADEVSKGRKLGPYLNPPFSNYVGSPMGAFQKPSTGGIKTRIITDLSWPPGTSINDYISKECSTVSYVTIDHAVEMVKACGQGCEMMKLDLTDAYRNIVVQPESWHLLGTTWQTNSGQVLYYVDTRLPFGLRSSAKQFDLFAKGLQYIMHNIGVTRSLQYLDDYFSVSPKGSDECKNNLLLMKKACQFTGLPVNQKKCHGPTTRIEFLGVIIDSNVMELQLSVERVNNIKAEMLKWRNKKKGSKRQLLSLIGKLNFVARIVRAGRTFTRRLIECTKKLKHLHFTTRLSKAAQKDIDWWLQYITLWNYKSVFYDNCWIDSVDLNFKTDASSTGFGAVLGNHWLAGTFSDKQRQSSIEWKELFAVTVALKTWSHLLVGKRIIIHCDNMSMVQAVNKGASKINSLMDLIRTLVMIAALKNFEYKLVHIQGKLNFEADLLSRQKIAEFKSRFPAYTDTMSTPELV